MKLVTATPGMRGFDCNVSLTRTEADALKAHGYDFVMRYVRRSQVRPVELTLAETVSILASGLLLGIVQNVESEKSWEPYASKGKLYGEVAALDAKRCGLPAQSLIFCDLEGTDGEAGERGVVEYCNAWADSVTNAGFLPGLYVGWHCGISPDALYNDLDDFHHYWAAYNLDEDEEPLVRGVQMRQHEAKPEDRPEGITFEFDVNTVKADRLGGLPVFIGA